MTLEELKQINIDIYVNLMRIKKVQKDTNEELDYQIKVAETKLNSLGVSINDLSM